jgi:hypothetical protein
MSLNYSFVRGCLVDLIGIEPMTSSMPWKRAPSCATGPLIGKDSLYSPGCGTASQTDELGSVSPQEPRPARHFARRSVAASAFQIGEFPAALS